jgi:hypothetical protein
MCPLACGPRPGRGELESALKPRADRESGDTCDPPRVSETGLEPPQPACLVAGAALPLQAKLRNKYPQVREIRSVSEGRLRQKTHASWPLSSHLLTTVPHDGGG